MTLSGVSRRGFDLASSSVESLSSVVPVVLHGVTMVAPWFAVLGLSDVAPARITESGRAGYRVRFEHDLAGASGR